MVSLNFGDWEMNKYLTVDNQVMLKRVNKINKLTKLSDITDKTIPKNIFNFRKSNKSADEKNHFRPVQEKMFASHH